MTRSVLELVRGQSQLAEQLNGDIEVAWLAFALDHSADAAAPIEHLLIDRVVMPRQRSTSVSVELDADSVAEELAAIQAPVRHVAWIHTHPGGVLDAFLSGRDLATAEQLASLVGVPHARLHTTTQPRTVTWQLAANGFSTSLSTLRGELRFNVAATDGVSTETLARALAQMSAVEVEQTSARAQYASIVLSDHAVYAAISDLNICADSGAIRGRPTTREVPLVVVEDNIPQDLEALKIVMERVRPASRRSV